MFKESVLKGIVFHISTGISFMGYAWKSLCYMLHEYDVLVLVFKFSWNIQAENSA